MLYQEDFIGAIKIRQGEISLSLTTGHAADYVTYQRLVGQYAGLAEALNILNNLLKEDEHD